MPDAPGLATRTILSPNHYSGWTKGPPTAVVIHSTRSGQPAFSDALELQATINWFSKVSSQASSHWVISELERVRVVDDRYPAWHAVEHSWDAYGIEVCQPTRDRPYKEGHYTNLVKVCLPYVRAGIPIVHLPAMVSPGDAAGFIGHDKTAQGLRDGKSDPGSLFNWTKFITMLVQAQGGGEDLTETEVRKIVAEILYERGPGHLPNVIDAATALEGPLTRAVKRAVPLAGVSEERVRQIVRDLVAQ